MEKSIESIWKEGFLKSDALVAPKLNNLYNQKSKHIVDKFKKMFKINLILIVVWSFIVLILSFVIGIPYMGVPMFFILNILVILNKKLLSTLTQIDKGMSSYDYLISFDGWLKDQVRVNKRFSRILYPSVFLTVILGFWMKEIDEVNAGDLIVSELLESYPNLYLINGVPGVIVLGVFVVLGLLVLAGGKIYEWDLKLVYGRVFRKLDEIIADIKELKG